jgi:beta-glucanase (GH16 family)
MIGRSVNLSFRPITMACAIGILLALLASGQTPVLVFNEDFQGSALSNAWVAMNRPGDGNNNEKQCYLPSNAVVTGDLLALTSKVDSSCQGYSYTSAMVQWRSYNFTYGTVEVRAKMAGGTGTWPAAWLLGANCQQTNVISADNAPPCSWPNPGSDEIDIAEIKNSNLSTVWQNVISGSSGFQTCTPTTANTSQNWHVYSIEWSAGSLVWKIDGQTTCSFTRNIPSTPMFLMLNVAVGGNGGGTVVNSTLPQTMSVDYVRVYQNGPITTSRCDLNSDNAVNEADYQIALNQSLGIAACATADLNGDGKCNVVDLQRVVNAGLGQPCRTDP